ncbi:MAG: M81 family metallopeptidase [Rhodospirillales bacterium]|nr:M81 family metallopeptidase [Rhodospirillales bacterium]
MAAGFKVAVGGFQHETNTFAPSKARFEDFARAGAWPGLTRGPGLFEAVAGINIPIAGFIEQARGLGHELLPLSWSQATPSAEVAEDAFERIAGEMLDDLQALVRGGGLDGLYLDLHGAMVTEHTEDGEGELLRRVRAVVGDSLPVVVSLDLHANVTPEMVDLADALIAFRTYPHIDMAATGARAARHLDALLQGEAGRHKAFRQLPFLMQITAGCTLHEPARGLYRRLAELEGGAVSSLSFACGFPPADIRHCGASVLAYGKTRQAADAAAGALYAHACEREGEFVTPTWRPAEAVARAMALAEGSDLPVILVDTEDNPGGGADSDSVNLLAELVRQGAEAAVGLIYDPEVAAAAHEAGEGAELTVSLGAKSGFPGYRPLEASYRVERLGDGCITGSGPFYKGARMQLGPMALLRLGDVVMAVVSRKQQAADQEMFRHLGVEPAERKILALKSTAHFRAHFQPIAAEIMIVAAGGPNAVDNQALAYRRLRPGLRLMPLGPAFRPPD